MNDLVAIEFQLGGRTYSRPFDLSQLGDQPLCPIAMTGSMPHKGYDRMFVIDEMGRVWIEDMDSNLMLGIPKLTMHFLLEDGPAELREWYADLCHEVRKNFDE